MTAYDPYGISPNFAAQGADAVTAWKQALAKLNFQKNSVLDKYGFTSGQGDVGVGGVSYNPDGTVASVSANGGMTGVGAINELVGRDNKSGFGGFRDELNAENDALNAADSGPNRGFSGGLANQAKNAAQMAVNRSQQGFTQGFNQFAAGVNQQGLETTAGANSQLGGILQDQTNWKSNEAAYQSTLSAGYTPGVSGGGSTPIGANASAAAVGYAKSLGYSVDTKYMNAHSKPVTFTGTNSAGAARGGHATAVAPKPMPHK